MLCRLAPLNPPPPRACIQASEASEVSQRRILTPQQGELHLQFTNLQLHLFERGLLPQPRGGRAPPVLLLPVQAFFALDHAHCRGGTQLYVALPALLRRRCRVCGEAGALGVFRGARVPKPLLRGHGTARGGVGASSDAGEVRPVRQVEKGLGEIRPYPLEVGFNNRGKVREHLPYLPLSYATALQIKKKRPLETARARERKRRGKGEGKTSAGACSCFLRVCCFRRSCSPPPAGVKVGSNLPRFDTSGD
mmetsp:Transcript_8249/g.28325  ORF Transcript_8249/g.28325 Transcript_8249/m.28325 type:complete len:250 (-) Transcript_8249:40-789(-)